MNFLGQTSERALRGFLSDSSILNQGEMYSVNRPLSIFAIFCQLGELNGPPEIHFKAALTFSVVGSVTILESIYSQQIRVIHYRLNIKFSVFLISTRYNGKILIPGYFIKLNQDLLMEFYMSGAGIEHVFCSQHAKPPS